MDDPKGFTRLMLIPIAAMFLNGCQQTSQPTSQATTSSVRSTIIADCIAGYYQQGQAPYITQQTHIFNPAAGSLKISADEPTGVYTFTRNNNQFSKTKETTAFLSGLPASFVNQQLATGLYYSFCAGANLLNTDKFEAQEPIKIEGQWYQPLPVNPKSSVQATLLKNMTTNRVDQVEVSQYEDGFIPERDVLYFYKPIKHRWLLRCYNYRYSKELETLVPMKIDVYDTAAGLASKKLIIQVEYKRVQTQ